MLRLNNSLDLHQTHGHCFVTSGYNFTAWSAQAVLSNVNAVASHTLVTIHSETALTDTAYFGRHVLDAKTLGCLAGADTLAVAECGKQLVSFCSWIDIAAKRVYLK